MKQNTKALIWYLIAATPLAIGGVFIVSFPWWRVPHEAGPEWKVPQTKPAGKKGELVGYGEQLFNQTSQYVGPEVKDASLRYAGNHLACQSCHAAGGTQRNALGLIGVAWRFPQFNARAGKKIELEDRVNGCFERSMNGRALPKDSREMQAYLAYFHWLSSEVPEGTKHLDGQGLPVLEPLSRWADPNMGEAVYRQRCTKCHGPNGLGTKAEDGTYKYPPLWGDDSFNNGAGMNRIRTAASFIYLNMPNDDPSLTPEQAFDVAAYMDSQQRPERAGLERDYPDRKLKPFDCPYPPYPDGFSEERHKYGPYVDNAARP